MNKYQLKKKLPKKINKKQIQRPQKKASKYKLSNEFGLVIIILLGIIIYANSFSTSFNFDDYNSIVNNLAIRNLSNVKEWWNFSLNRPVSIFTFALNYHFNQLDVWYYHLVNLFIHLINSILVWWFTLLIFSTPQMKNHTLTRHKKNIAFFTALLFVSHPLATQSVTYIVQRMTSLSTLFYLLSIVLYIKARLSETKNSSKYILFGCSLISAVLAVLTKENAYTLPFTFVLLEIFFLQTKKYSINFKDYKFILLIITFLSLIIFVFLKFSLSVFNTIPPSNGYTYSINPLNYLFTEFSVIVKYIQLLFLPVNQNLDYDFPISNNFFEIRTLLSFLFLVSLIILAIFLFKRNRIISFCIFWFFITLSIESSIIPINDVIYEHRTYLPSFGFFLIISSGIYILFYEKYKYIAFSIFLIIIVSNSYLTVERNNVWKDDLTLWSDVVSKSPNKARPIYSRGYAYFGLGKLEMAIADFSKSIEINSRYTEPYFMRGDTYDKLGEWEKAINDFSKIIEIDPKNSTAYYNRGVIYELHSQSDKAIEDYSEAIKIKPKYFNAFLNRGIIYNNLGQTEKAICDFSKSIELEPLNTNVLTNRGIAYYKLGQLDNAIKDFSEVTVIAPKSSQAFYDRGLCYSKLNQTNKAIEDYSIAINNKPDYFEAYFNRGNAYEKLGQLDKAKNDFLKVIEIEPTNTNTYTKLYYLIHNQKSKEK